MHPPTDSQNLALFLDFDGTLVDMAPTPQSVVVPDGLPALLQVLNTRLHGALAIVSGRELANVFSFLQPYTGPGAGSHGLEMRLADGRLAAPSPDIGAIAQQIMRQLQPLATKHAALVLEQKSWSASLHYRGDPLLEGECLAAMEAIVAPYAGWEVTYGKMVVEARPASVSKANAVQTFMAAAPFEGRVPVFVGDDRTDEDGMRAAIALGGYGVKVGAGETLATYRLSDPDAVLNYLHGLVQ